MREQSVWKGLVAGLAGGLAASAVMGPVHEWARKNNQAARSGEDATVKAAEAVSEGVADHSLSRKEKKVAGPAVHFAFGGGMGAAYGAVAEVWPEVTTGFGAPFGAAVYGGAHAVAVPVLSLSKPITESSPQAESAEFAAHLVYGIVTDLVRLGVRKALA